MGPRRAKLNSGSPWCFEPVVRTCFLEGLSTPNPIQSSLPCSLCNRHLQELLFALVVTGAFPRMEPKPHCLESLTQGCMGVVWGKQPLRGSLLKAVVCA